jgi:hypothetical protein
MSRPWEDATNFDKGCRLTHIVIEPITSVYKTILIHFMKARRNALLDHVETHVSKLKERQLLILYIYILTC